MEKEERRRKEERGKRGETWGIGCAESMRNSMGAGVEMKGHELSSINTFLL